MSVLLQLQPATQTAAPDATATLSVYVVTSEALTGLDWAFAPGTAQLLSRDLAGSAFPDPVGDLTGDLGASVQNVAQAVGPGEFLVGHYTFRVAGVRTVITPKAFPGTTGWVGSAPDFIEAPFSGFGAAQIDFPEPAIGLLAGLVWGMLRRRRRHAILQNG